MTYPTLLAELEVAIRAGSPEKREETLRRITSLFLNESDRLNEQQISVFGDVLAHLVQKVETRALVELSRSLASVSNAPIEVIRHLSNYDRITVAGPVLTGSQRLTEGDLIEVVESKSRGHLLAISGRASLTESVTDALIERGDRRVCHRLAKNPGAKLSQHGFAALVRKSDYDEKLAETLGLRLDIPFKFLRELLARTTNLVRSRLLTNASPKNQEKIRSALASIANEPNSEAPLSRDFTRADNVAHDLNRCGQLTEAALVDFVKAKKYEEMTATLALFSGVTSGLIEGLLRNGSCKEILIACKAGNLTWPTVMLILETRIPSISKHEIIEARDVFIELSRPSAQEFMRSM